MKNQVKRYQVRCSINGYVIEDFLSIRDAKSQIIQFEKLDKAENIYEEGFYEIYDCISHEIVITH